MIEVNGVIPWSIAERPAYEEVPTREIHIATRDLPRALAFYERLFGLSAIGEDGEGLVYVPATPRTSLVFHDVAESPPRPEAFVRELGFVVADLDRARWDIWTLGVQIARESGTSDRIFRWPNGRSLYIHAPDGVEIELAEMRTGRLRRYRVVYSGGEARRARPLAVAARQAAG